MISHVVPLCNFRRTFWLLNNAARDKLPENYGIISPRDDTLKFRTWHALVNGRSVEVGRFFCLRLVLNGTSEVHDRSFEYFDGHVSLVVTQVLADWYAKRYFFIERPNRALVHFVGYFS